MNNDSLKYWKQLAYFIIICFGLFLIINIKFGVTTSNICVWSIFLGQHIQKICRWLERIF